jgi:hypothetical protein
VASRPYNFKGHIYFTKPSDKKRVQKEAAVRKQLRTSKNAIEFLNLKQIPKKFIGL